MKKSDYINDFWTQKAKKEGYKARSVYKLQEIDQKFKIFDRQTKNILDIGCAPWSWTQYIHRKLQNLWIPFEIIGLDIQSTDLNLPNVQCYKQDATKLEEVKKIISQHGIEQFDVIVSDMAPNTIWHKSTDALRSMALIEQTLPIYQQLLKSNGKFVIKVFMWPWFDEFIASLKKFRGGKSIKTFKPQAVRKDSKEIYIVKT